MSNVLDVWLEAQIDGNSISLTLISEHQDDGVVVEETARYTVEEIQDMRGGMFNLNLSAETRGALKEDTEDVFDLMRDIEENDGSYEEGAAFEEGDVVVDDNPRNPRANNTLVVENAFDDISANDWVIDKSEIGPDSTVADKNPSYPEDDSVVLARYDDGDHSYAFPESRLRPQ